MIESMSRVLPFYFLLLAKSTAMRSKLLHQFYKILKELAPSASRDAMFKVSNELSCFSFLPIRRSEPSVELRSLPSRCQRTPLS